MSLKHTGKVAYIDYRYRVFFKEANQLEKTQFKKKNKEQKRKCYIVREGVKWRLRKDKG